MISLDPDDLTTSGRYRLLTGMVVPRPIAWVTSQGSDGSPVNLAPFSCFTFVCYEPMLVAFVVGRKLGTRKDTASNIAASGEFVLHIADESLVEALHFSAVEHPSNISEVEHLGLGTAPSETVAVPRLERAPIALECRLDRTIEFGDIRSEMIVGRVLRVHLRKGLMKDGKIETTDLNPVARIGGPRYTTIGPVISLPSIAASMAVNDH
jgi:flavin reductase (DIM6/NTAB) family NADH-FMN oxidoreductase RutF